MLLYLHIPYCDSKCHYCSFNSYVTEHQTQTAYLEAVQRQLHHELMRFKASQNSIETLYIGGGTPSTIAPENYVPFFEAVAPYLHPKAEITVEANPNSATRCWLEGMKELGVTRISFGVQSFHDDKLKALGRAHTSHQANEAILAAKEIGIEHLSLDLIYNYQGDNSERLTQDIKTAFSLPIDHISAYELTIEDGTKFAQTPEVRQEKEALAFEVANQITQQGFAHYEISNFGRYQSRHNLGYWKLEDYIGVGAGAVGFLTNQRFYPSADIQNYIANPLAITTETLTEDDLLTERLFLGLRSSVGVDYDIAPPSMKNRAKVLLEEQKLYLEQGRLYNLNYFLADELALFLLGS